MYFDVKMSYNIYGNKVLRNTYILNEKKWNKNGIQNSF